MNYIKIEGNCLTVMENNIVGAYDMAKTFGTNEVVSLEDQDTGGGCMVDIIHLSNGKSVCISDELIAIYPNAKEFYDGWVTQEIVDNSVVEYISWYELARLKVQQHKLMWGTIDGDSLSAIGGDQEYVTELSLTKLTGTNAVTSVINEHPGIDVITMANNKIISISGETLLVHSGVDARYACISNNIEPLNTIDLYDGAWTTQYKIKVLNEYISNMYDPSEMSGNHDLWEKCIHLHQNDKGVLEIPFDKSFDEYSEWSEVPGGAYEFFRWFKSIVVSLGHKYYKEEPQEGNDSVKVIIPGLCDIYISLTHPNETSTERWIDGMKLSEELDKNMFDCGVNLWYDILSQLAVELNVDKDQLQYHFASVNALDIVFYDGERWMPAHAYRVIQLCMAEGFTQAEMKDKSFMDDKYFNWAESGMLS